MDTIIITNNLPQEEYQNREKITSNIVQKKCKKCGKEIPRFLKDGLTNKKYDCRRRVYCFDCSPFNERKLCGAAPKYYEKGKENIRNHIKVDRVCKTCGKIFNQNSRNNECSTCRNYKQRSAKRKKALDMKGGKCSKCGYDKCIAALDFHHIDPKEKLFSLSCHWNYEWDMLEKEIAKCILLCRNCHAELHDNERKTP